MITTSSKPALHSEFKASLHDPARPCPEKKELGKYPSALPHPPPSWVWKEDRRLGPGPPAGWGLLTSASLTAQTPGRHPGRRGPEDQDRHDGLGQAPLTPALLSSPAVTLPHPGTKPACPSPRPHPHSLLLPLCVPCPHPPPAPLPSLLPLYFISTCHKSAPLQSSYHLCSGPLSVATRPERAAGQTIAG